MSYYICFSNLKDMIQVVLKTLHPVRRSQRNTTGFPYTTKQRYKYLVHTHIYILSNYYIHHILLWRLRSNQSCFTALPLQAVFRRRTWLRIMMVIIMIIIIVVYIISSNAYNNKMRYVRTTYIIILFIISNRIICNTPFDATSSGGSPTTCTDGTRFVRFTCSVYNCITRNNIIILQSAIIRCELGLAFTTGEK